MKKHVLVTLMCVAVLTLGLIGCASKSEPEVETPAEAETEKEEAEAPTESTGAADDYPNKAINLNVIAKAGGGTDLNARLMAKYLTEELGQPVTVTNIAGSAGALAMQETLDSEADGYTFVFTNDAVVDHDVLGTADFSYQDFDIVANMFCMDMYLVGSKDIPDVAAIVEKEKANPGSVVYGAESSGYIAVLPHLINNQLGTQIKIVDGGQTAERMPLMVSGQINLTFLPYSSFKDYYEKGDLTAVAVVGAERSTVLPDVPTTGEQGLNTTFSRFQCVLGPKGIDPAIVQKMSDAMKAISANQAFIDEAAALGVNVVYEDAAALEQRMADYTAAYTDAMTLME